ncbi:uncharacterized protein K452DRAFT_226953 [Aplosporella prunicola CBS 121167]|uniref:MHYT domain-containing protein n=1 Tax=Aplosporella prunicola CBS 121167 TaxID=1176127 RepID=A0A6A6BE31_9PEZI|nr:uncharacterized protein K452DRAFT_226953 [Aplosporella prunicola CBS 121167]KAF2142429.1 hypothetical protein K452DRAFT_226953 [Aplosporella prunicola CBS 121167]
MSSEGPGFRPGEVVDYHVVWWIVFCSFLTSLIGDVATVEILHRRRGHGWRNFLTLLAPAVSFGLVGIWCMHFVGNRAIEMGDGHPAIQLYYDPRYTALSVFLPIGFLYVGFAFAEHFNRSRTSMYLALVVTGILAGLAIVGMHYIGNLGTTNYRLNNKPKNICGASLIAVFACWLSFTLFFHQREHWINSFPRRFLCACLLAVAVCGMHWTAAQGTKYELREYYHGDPAHRNNNLIVAVVLSFIVLFVFCPLLVWLGNRRKKQLADRAQHVVLASVTFDMEGKILVTQEGLLPSQKITRKYNQRTFSDEFNIAHPVFQWIFRVSHNWSSVVELIGPMRSHLRAIGSLKDPSAPSSRGKSAVHGVETPKPEVDYSVIFREHFCVAASELASALDTRMQNLGKLWDGILTTGTTAKEVKRRSSRQAASPDPEAGISMPTLNLVGRGQLLFLVRMVEKEASQKLVNEGFRWATMDQVGGMLASSLQVSRKEISTTVEKLSVYADRRAGLPTHGTYLSYFCMRPTWKPSLGTWEVLVEKDESSHLPMVPLFEREQPDEKAISFYSHLDGLSIHDIKKYLNNSRVRQTFKSLEEHHLATKMDEAIDRLHLLIPETFFGEALFINRVFRDYAQWSDGYPRGVVMAFVLIPDVHTSSLKSEHLTYSPLSFFRCRQHVHHLSTDHQVLAHAIHREFHEVRNQQHMGKDKKGVVTSSNVGRMMHRSSTHVQREKQRMKSLMQTFTPTRRDSTMQNDTASERELVQFTSRNDSDATSHGFGGIMVSTDIAVERDVTATKEDSVMELKELGFRSDVGVGDQESVTFADELFEIACARWRR